MGSVTMLRTEVWLPPIWDTRLPQKFSAATTLTTPPEIEHVLPEVPMVVSPA